MNMQKIGELAFLVLVVISVIAGLFMDKTSPWAGTVAAVLVVLGILVGLLNIAEGETTPFLVAAIALLMTSNVDFGLIKVVGPMINSIVYYIGVATAPAALVVAVKGIYGLAATH